MDPDPAKCSGSMWIRIRIRNAKYYHFYSSRSGSFSQYISSVSEENGDELKGWSRAKKEADMKISFDLSDNFQLFACSQTNSAAPDDDPEH